MTSILSNHFANAALALIKNPSYLALHLDTPSFTNSPSNEVAGLGYARQKAYFAAPSSKTRVINKAITFTGMPNVTVTDMAVWDALSGGNLLVIIHLPRPITVAEHGHFAVAAGDVAFSL